MDSDTVSIVHRLAQELFDRFQKWMKKENLQNLALIGWVQLMEFIEKQHPDPTRFTDPAFAKAFRPFLVISYSKRVDFSFLALLECVDLQERTIYFGIDMESIFSCFRRLVSHISYALRSPR